MGVDCGESQVNLRAVGNIGLLEQYFRAAARHEPWMRASFGEIEQCDARSLGKQAIGSRPADITETSGYGHNPSIQSIQDCPQMLVWPAFAAARLRTYLQVKMIS